MPDPLLCNVGITLVMLKILVIEFEWLSESTGRYRVVAHDRM